MKRFVVVLISIWILVTLAFTSAAAQDSSEWTILDGIQLAQGFDMGVNSAGSLGSRTDWLYQDVDKMKMVYPSGQDWGAVFITVGTPKDPPRPSVSIATYLTLSIEIKGDMGNTVQVGIKDDTQKDDGSETKFTLPTYGDWIRYVIPLAKFRPADLTRVYVVTEFVFAGTTGQTLYVRNVKLTKVPAPEMSGVVNGASFVPNLSPGAWITALGTNLSTITRTWDNGDFLNGKLPVALSGIGLSLGNRPLPLYYISPAQLNALLPSAIATGAAWVSATNSTGASVPVPLSILNLSPALFTFAPEGARYPAAVFPDGSIVGKIGLLGSDVPTRPAKPGEIISLFGTGFGPTDPAVSHEVILDSPAPLAASVRLRVRLGGLAADLQYAGVISPALYQFNVVVPNVADGDQPISMDVGDGVLGQSLFLTVKR